MTKRRVEELKEKSDEEKSYEYSMPVFTPVVPPKIKSISKEALVKWQKLRKEYEAKMRSRCRSSGEDYSIITQTVKESFDHDLLEVFCTMRLDKEVADCTEGMLIEELQRLLTSVKNDYLPDIKALFKRELRMDLRRVTEIVRQHGLAECLEGREGEEQKCKRVIASLAPPTLKADVKTIVQWKDKDAGKNLVKLYKLVYERAKEHERHFQQQKRLKTGRADKDIDRSKLTVLEARSEGQKPFQSKSASKQKEKKTAVSTEQKKVGKEVDKKGKKASTREPPSPCPKCQQMHWLSDCPDATEAEKVVLRQKLREASKARKAGLKRLGELLPNMKRTATLNGVLTLPYCPDTGSEHTVLTHAMFEELVVADGSVVEEPLDIPVHCIAYGSHVVVANTKAMVRLMIHTAAGAVEIAEPVPSLIVDTQDEELILEQLANRQQDDATGDPLELEVDDPPVSRAEAATEAVEVLIKRALENGFPVEKVEKLRVIVHMYDVWRLELRDDPPARVPPLELRLKEGAQPTKCKPRKYPPHIRNFLQEFNDKLVALGLV
ncbi:hypothetical protein PPTG_22702 [Phytophthora nicotianae INRA-310]|uniref:Uncharacterized protein n=1 Tax=Phytophthora nicotianae (strain INRA-310) TaxID=761204 RepID=W2QEX1_PHYN3|nr:hypothetical protein PPTG_22702 [Phytophthora nicotianae INRA-310]ETN10805.1 hypothetical protein PPTG_22702 [Phytophthora nicotianae INRA-310]